MSMVATPCRAFAMAARWNGHAPQVATGVARTSDSQAQPGKCGGMANSTTGTASTREIRSRGVSLVGRWGVGEMGAA